MSFFHRSNQNGGCRILGRGQNGASKLTAVSGADNLNTLSMVLNSIVSETERDYVKDKSERT
jgi:hypothetical protein